MISYRAEASIPLRRKVAVASPVFSTAKRLDDAVSLLGSIELPGEPVLLVAAVSVSEDRSRPGSRARSVATRR